MHFDNFYNFDPFSKLQDCKSNLGSKESAAPFEPYSKWCDKILAHPKICPYLLDYLYRLREACELIRREASPRMCHFTRAVCRPISGGICSFILVNASQPSNLYWGSWCDISISRLQGVPFVLCIHEFDKNFEDLDISIGSFSPGKDFEVVSKMTPKKPYSTYSVKSITSSVISCLAFSLHTLVNHFENVKSSVISVWLSSFRLQSIILSI